ncbi:MAG: hypothetical protein FJ320_11335 [SAR202 cluster bacterium]|nr:hypothetical protein [SAR202 cluster bacterium]
MPQDKPLLFTVFVQVKPESVKEFNKWYDDHVIEVVDCPGFLDGHRYEALGLEGANYLAIYHIESAKALETPEFGKARGWKEFQPVVIKASNAVYQPIHFAPAPARAGLGVKPSLLRFNRSEPVPEKESEYNHWYNNIHLPELMQCPGYISAERYVAVKGAPKYMAMYQMTDYAQTTPEFNRVKGFRQLEPYVREKTNITYKPIYQYAKKLS